MNIIFSCQFFSVTDDELNAYESAYQGLNIPQELRRMDIWLRANPTRRKSNYHRFITNWLARSYREIRPTRQQQTMQRVTEEVIRGAQELGAGRVDRQLARPLLQPVPHRS